MKPFNLFMTPLHFKALFCRANFLMAVARTVGEVQWRSWQMSQLREWNEDEALARDLDF